MLNLKEVDWWKDEWREAGIELLGPSSVFGL
jgi:hypothetical protein